MSFLGSGRISDKKLTPTKSLSVWQLLLFAVVFAAVGGIIIWRSLAANPNLSGDLNNDNVVNIFDLSILLSHYGTNFAAADINNDGIVDVFDLSALLTNYGQIYTPPNTVCTTADTSGCDNVGGKTITFNDVTTEQGNTGLIFDCLGSLASYTDGRATITGSGWPVHVNINFTHGSYNYGSGQPISAGTMVDLGAAALSNNCTGDGDPSTIDLIMHIEGDGRTYGVQKDALKLNGTTGPSNIQMTTGGGSLNCGPRQGANALNAEHQDGIQVQNGNGIGFYGVTVGDWSNQRATCWGAGGALFISASGGHTGQNITISHVKGVACNHGLNGDAGGLPTSGNASNSVFRTGRPSDQTDVLGSIDSDTGTNTVGLCSVATAPVAANTLGLSGWTFTNVIGDPWAQTGQAWAPGYNSIYNLGL